MPKPTAAHFQLAGKLFMLSAAAHFDQSSFKPPEQRVQFEARKYALGVLAKLGLDSGELLDPTQCLQAAQRIQP